MTRERWRTKASDMSPRMGRQGLYGNGTAVLLPRTLATNSGSRGRPRPPVRPIARDLIHPLPHLFDLCRSRPCRSAQALQVPSVGVRTHRTGRSLTVDDPAAVEPFGQDHGTGGPHVSCRLGTSGPHPASIGPTARFGDTRCSRKLADVPCSAIAVRTIFRTSAYRPH
jgi:hypothetical protein